MNEKSNKISGDALLVCTGRMCSGKDHLALKAGYTCVSIAEPLYRLAKYYLGTDDKKKPEVRGFLQTLGAWGRGEETKTDSVKEQGKEDVVKNIREKGGEMTGMQTIDWGQFGKKRSFWLEAAAKHARDDAMAGKKVAITNARFKEELETLKQMGFHHVHVLCSEEERIKRAGRNYSKDIDEDVTEKMAIELNAEILQRGIQAAGGAVVVWSENTKPPVKGILTVQTFLRGERAEEEAFLLRGKSVSPAPRGKASLAK